MLTFGASACKGCDPQGVDAPPWRVEGERAPYALSFPASWIAEPPHSINPHAEVAASLNDTLFFMVIPQKLPTFPTPDVFELQRLGIDTLDQAVDNLIIDRQSPIRLDGIEGLSVIARGELDGDPVRYINAYLVRDGYGFQLIAFASDEHSEALITEVDAILASWKNLSPPSAEADQAASLPSP
ncbi:hypothetical protein DL240_03765 [Lujinxingia litoralis]|uniref:DUF1795 domain-containing protein n=1 Tax=Lujinxingia litoralis TaxID=2211119 RepID=A0A328CBC9_9DELT|nr:hypothetical protein DL240_03765 [Lujinxingia litoralis]